ncbi:MAG: diaminobutyrate acetyltransferase [Maricaulaceae bacterium]
MDDVTTIIAEKADNDVRPRSTAVLRAPVAEDGADVHDLIAACPPLDQNSLYANLLQCSDFADTCAIAHDGEEAVGWVSGYRPPSKPDVYFLWQVAVRESARGQGLPKRLVAEIFDRPALEGVRYLETTITPDNEASWALFHRIADWLDAPLKSRPRFDRKIHFKGRHESETLVVIGPFDWPNPSS